MIKEPKVKYQKEESKKKKKKNWTSPTGYQLRKINELQSTNNTTSN